MFLTTEMAALCCDRFPRSAKVESRSPNKYSDFVIKLFDFVSSRDADDCAIYKVGVFERVISCRRGVE